MEVKAGCMKVTAKSMDLLCHGKWHQSVNSTNGMERSVLLVAINC